MLAKTGRRTSKSNHPKTNMLRPSHIPTCEIKTSSQVVIVHSVPYPYFTDPTSIHPSIHPTIAWWPEKLYTTHSLIKVVGCCLGPMQTNVVCSFDTNIFFHTLLLIECLRHQKKSPFIRSIQQIYFSYVFYMQSVMEITHAWVFSNTPEPIFDTPSMLNTYLHPDMWNPSSLKKHRSIYMSLLIIKADVIYLQS